ncbi:BTAD domain-containing putative transcriptional regulator [Micromonospora sp. NPDC048935]|uniref:BTAD domain-containing putative transcriptional regulator n=1 Tax=Micromonospora sp. NPDC048935 TaxID=3364262 RepID=UPI00371F845A
MESSGGQLRLQVLGPLRLWRDGVELSAGPRQQAYLLALLLARAGKPISMSGLVELIWDDDVPASAVNILQKYVGGLRRLLEPALPLRGSGSYLQRRGNGYLFTAGPGMLDVVTFRELVEAAKAAVAEQRSDEALGYYARAVGLWQSFAADGLTYGLAAEAIFAALDGEFFDACVAAADLAISLGQPERVLQALHLAARMAPLHETVQAGYISALAANGQQAEALSVFRTVRARLAEDLGLDPGPALVAAHRRVLGPSLAQEPPDERRQVPAAGVPIADHLAGRARELRVLRQSMASAFAGGTGLVLVEGEPGAGKTRLLEEAGAEAARRGALVLWVRCLEGDGTPSMWPWVEAVGTLLDVLPDAVRQTWHTGELGRLLGTDSDVPATPGLSCSRAQFRLFEQVVALVGRVSVRRLLVLVMDDLQWADTASLNLFSYLTARLPGGIAVIGALRDRAPMPGPELGRMLATASRLPGHRRIRLGPLGPAEVAELVRLETGHAPDLGAARIIHARTAGNPFLVRELSRLLADGGTLTENAAARTAVPATVRDVVRDRVAGLGNDARDLLRIAALIARDFDLTLLANTAGIDLQTCLDRIEQLEELGLLAASPGNPYSFRFAHDLVRESVAGTTSPPHAARIHLLVADALQRTVAGDESAAGRVAHHLRAAGPLADPARTAAGLVRAGRHPANNSAHDAAEGSCGQPRTSRDQPVWRSCSSPRYHCSAQSGSFSNRSFVVS